MKFLSTSICRIIITTIIIIIILSFVHILITKLCVDVCYISFIDTTLLVTCIGFPSLAYIQSFLIKEEQLHRFVYLLLIFFTLQIYWLPEYVVCDNVICQIVASLIGLVIDFFIFAKVLKARLDRDLWKSILLVFVLLLIVLIPILYVWSSSESVNSIIKLPLIYAILSFGIALINVVFTAENSINSIQISRQNHYEENLFRIIGVIKDLLIQSKANSHKSIDLKKRKKLSNQQKKDVLYLFLSLKVYLEFLNKIGPHISKGTSFFENRKVVFSSDITLNQESEYLRLLAMSLTESERALLILAINENLFDAEYSNLLKKFFVVPVLGEGERNIG